MLDLIQGNSRFGKFQRYNGFRRTEENQIRQSQLITPFGIGALTDIKNRSVIVADSEFWDDSTVEANLFFDNRLQQAMNAGGFIEPPAGKNQDTVAVRTFPSWYFSPRTRELKPIWTWKSELRESNPNGRLHQLFAQEPFHEWLANEAKKTMRIDLIPVRIVCACAHGHVQDFPWFEWAHSSGKKQNDVKHHVLKLTNNGGSGTIGDMLVSCNCGMRRSLSGIFGENAGAALAKIGVSCHGQFGWKQKNTHDSCDELLKPMMRNSNSLYFPNIVKSVNIPLKENATIEQIQATNSFRELEKMLAAYDTDAAQQKALYEPWANTVLGKIATEIYGSDDGNHVEEIRDRIENYQTSNSVETKISETDYRREEYAVLMGLKEYREDTGRFDIVPKGADQFPDNSKLASLFERITLVNQLEVVSVLKSYSRIRPIESKWMTDQEGAERSEEGKNAKAVISEVSLKRSDDCYVGLRNHGEGVFVALDHQKLMQWAKRIAVTDFEKRVLRRAATRDLTEYEQEYINPEYYLIHTLSHLVIRELSFASGYSSSALQERIYFSDGSTDEDQMCGFLIYTSSTDSEGTLGGLVRQGLPQNFFEMLKGAIEKARWCSFDPTCIESSGQGRNSLNLAACHACALVSETSCERMNLFLDRGMLVGTLEDPTFGFFSDAF